jgi:LysM repeat protein
MRHPIRHAAAGMMLGIFILLAACTSQVIVEPTPTPTRQGTLTPFLTATPSSTPAPVDRTTPSPLPSPTPTLRVHVIERGQDLGGIAFRYGVNLPELLEVNPDVDPYFLVIGSSLNIPASTTINGETPAPTPVAVQLGEVHCSTARDGSAWCFVLATNSQSFDVESVSAVIRVADEKAAAVLSQAATGPLNLLPAGKSMPLAAYFPPKLPKEPLQASAELLTSLPAFFEEGRYIPVDVQDVVVTTSENGLEASVSGQISLDADAGQVWVAAAAYNESGEIVGLRRWENEEPLPAGRDHAFTIWVYSTGGEIERVEVLAEARP